MSRPKVMGTGNASCRLPIAFVAVSVAILWIAQPVVARAEKKDVSVKVAVKDEKDTPKTLTISYSYDDKKPDTLKNAKIGATLDSGPQPASGNPVSLPVRLGSHTKNLVAVYPGPIPIIVFDGSGSCVWVRDHWVHPPGVTCP